MSSSEDESAVQNILLRSKRSERTPLEIEVSELIKAKMIAADSATTITALQQSLKHDMNTHNQMLNEAVEAEKALKEVKMLIEKENAGEVTLDLSKEQHKNAKKLIDTHVSHLYQFHI